MRDRIWTAAVAVGIALGGVAIAQQQPTGPVDVYNAPPAPTSSAPGSDTATPAQPNFSKEQIAQLVAPLALYPDSLLTQILMASTYPLEVVQADRWVKSNTSLQGDELAKSLEQQPWDPSVKSLVNFPKVLAMMSDQLDTTVQLGNAFLAQQQDVLAAVQDLRGRAQQAGNLKSSDQVSVTSQPADAGDPSEQPGISIAPTADNLTYIPDYDPTTIYGAWPYPSYQPYSYYPAGYGVGGLAWGSSIIYSYPWGYAWGDCDWRHRYVRYDINRNDRWNHFIDRDRYHDHWERYREARNFRDNIWAHDARHRDGVPYPDARDAEIYRRRQVQDERAREAFRGRDWNDVNRDRDNDRRDNNNRNDNVRSDNDGRWNGRDVTITRGRTDASPRVDSRNDNDRGEVIRRERDINTDRERTQVDNNRNVNRPVDPTPTNRGNIGDINRTQAEERAAAERGRISRTPVVGPRPQAPVERSTPAPVRSEPAPTRTEPSPVRSAPAGPRVSTPAPRVEAPGGGGRGAPSVGPRGR